MEAKIMKWGNSQGIRIPKALLETARLSVTESVEIIAKNKLIIIKPIKERITIDKLFENWNGEKPEAYDWGEFDAPVGREIW